MNAYRISFRLLALAILAIPVAFTACKDDPYEMPSDVQWRSSGKAA